jgi:hypothetical protein
MSKTKFKNKSNRENLIYEGVKKSSKKIESKEIPAISVKKLCLMSKIKGSNPKINRMNIKAIFKTRFDLFTNISLEF